MPKAEKGTPKDIANRIKEKGLKKLKFYCQLCQKQCRDENGFKCHIQSDSHLRQIHVFSHHSSRMLDSFSSSFEATFLETLRRRHGTKRVQANHVYQELIQDRHHIHMNSTCWTTLTDFVQYLGKAGKCIVDETDKGWYIQYLDRDPALMQRQEAYQRRVDEEKNNEERYTKQMEKQRIEAAKLMDRAGVQLTLQATHISMGKEEEDDEEHNDKNKHKVQLKLKKTTQSQETKNTTGKRKRPLVFSQSDSDE